MPKFIVDEYFFEKVPQAVFGVVVAKGINNKEHYDWLNDMLEESIKVCQKNYLDKAIKETDPITYYREAFRAIGINPNKYMCSIEALVTRVVKKGELPHINTLVDLGNALSLKYNIPLGIHDIDRFKKDIEIRRATKDDWFIPFGSEEKEQAEEDEIIYVSGHDIKTRRWTWRQGENSKITEDTKNVFIPLDAFLENKESMLELQMELASILKNRLQAEVTLGIIDKDHREFVF